MGSALQHRLRRKFVGNIGEMLLHDLSMIVGEECWGVTGGEGTGSVILLNIGARTLMQRPLKNPHLTELVRRYDSAYALRIRSPWRIDSALEVVSGSHLPNSNDGRMVQGLTTICGKIITSVSCSAPGFDLTIEFDNQHSLVIHCSEIGWGYDDCYSFGSPPGYYSVGFDGDVSFQPSE